MLNVTEVQFSLGASTLLYRKSTFMIVPGRLIQSRFHERANSFPEQLQGVVGDVDHVAQLCKSHET